MKLVVLKLISLLVLLAGALILGLNLGISQPYAQQILDYVTPYLPTTEAGDINFCAPCVKYVGGGLMLLLGLYGFLPRLPKGRGKRQVAYSEKYGDVVIELDPAERMLNRIIRNLPEVRSMAIRIKADADGHGVLIDAKGVLNSQLGVAARDTREFVNASIATTATDILGLEVVPPINLRIKYTEVDIETATEALHDRLLQPAPAAPPQTTEATLEAMPVVGEAIPDEDETVCMKEGKGEAAASMDEPDAAAAEAPEEEDEDEEDEDEEEEEGEEAAETPDDEAPLSMPEPVETPQEEVEVFDADMEEDASEAEEDQNISAHDTFESPESDSLEQEPDEMPEAIEGPPESTAPNEGESNENQTKDPWSF